MEKKNNKGLIMLLIAIIVILSILCIFFAIVTINLNTNKENNNTNENRIITENSNIINTTNNIINNSQYENEINIIKEIFSNNTVQYLVDHVSVLYCKTEGNIINEEELGLNYKWNGYYKCSNFNSYEEITNHFKTYVTEEFFNTLLSSQPYLRQTTTLADNTTMYNYYEKDGILYAAMTGKGSNLNKWNFLKDESIYTIESVDNDKIIATIDAKWLNYSQTEYTEKVKISIKKDINNVWKVDSYETITN